MRQRGRAGRELCGDDSRTTPLEARLTVQVDTDVEVSRRNVNPYEWKFGRFGVTLTANVGGMVWR